MRVLIVEDNLAIARLLQHNLQNEGYVSDKVATGHEALKFMTDREYALIILDIGLPDMNGFEVCKKMREKGNQTPVLVLTAFRTTDDKVKGLDSGADDYIVKPFEMEELMARVRALLRRDSPTRNPILTVADLTLDPSTHDVKRGGKKLDLSATEYNLVEFLMRNTDHVVTRAEILRQVWGIEYNPGTNLVDVHIRNLRQKIDQGRKLKLIHTIRGFGYRLSEESAE